MALPQNHPCPTIEELGPISVFDIGYATHDLSTCETCRKAIDELQAIWRKQSALAAAARRARETFINDLLTEAKNNKDAGQPGTTRSEETE
jgi:hypothetical protein